MIFLVLVDEIFIGAYKAKNGYKNYFLILLSYRLTSTSMDLMGCLEAIIYSIFINMS